MLEHNPVELLRRVERLRSEASRSRYDNTNEIARRTHHGLLAKLDEMTVDLHDEIETEQMLLAGRGTPDGDDWYDIYHLCTRFEYRWVDSGPHSVLDPIHHDVTAEGEVCRATLDYSVVPAEELGSFGELLDQIKRETGVEFVAARV